MPGAFDGIRVIDFTQGRAGPYAGMLLAEQGADVIKVEPPAGDRARGTPAFHVLNRSKRGIVLDLTRREGRARARDLAAAADVLLVDQLPEHAKRQGIDYARLSRENPGLVYCSMPPYGSRGPLATLEPDDTLVAAVTGVLGLQWSYCESPVFLVVPIVAYATGVLAALAVAATLFDRARSGHGDHIEVSGLGGAFALQTSAYLVPLGALDVIRLSARKGTPRGPWPTYRVYEASDGEWFFLGALTPAFWTKLAVALGIEEYLADPRFETAPLGYPVPEDAQELSDRIAGIFATKPRQHWLDFLRQADVPAGPVQARDDYFQDPQVLHNGMRVEINDPEVGPTVQMGVPLLLRDTPGGIRGPAPLLGQHNEPVLTTPPPARAAAPPAAKGRLPGGAPLDGITVLDLGTIYAGPYAAMLLSDLGANVVKIEPLDGDPWRAFAIGFLGVNRGKRGLALDLKREQGRALFYDLVRKTDVVVDNFRAGVLPRLKMDYEALSAVSPRVICASVTPFGASGPMAGLPGFDPILQARSGLMSAQGGDGEEPVYHQIAVCDFITGLMTAYGVAAALYGRERSGRGQQVETSLANNAMAAQAGEFIRYDGRPPDPPGGRDVAGVSALYRVYRCADGWLFLAVRTLDQAEALLQATAGALASGDERDAGALLEAPLQGEIASALESFFSTRPTGDAFQALTERGIPCAACLTIKDLFQDEHLEANDLWWEMEHPVHGPMRQTGRIVKWTRRNMRLERPAPLLGQQSREVLLEFGIEPSRVAELIEKRVVLAP
jgi:crotonobetainyl-CoA:carnitine CoA-transferase CaiB-like acyl-CoA transferase